MENPISPHFRPPDLTISRSLVKFSVIIPARYASTRFPGKPLADIGGKPMVVRVAERASRSGADEVLIATDHAGIAAAAARYGYQAVMTRRNHASGTDRIAEVAAKRRIRRTTSSSTCRVTSR